MEAFAIADACRRAAASSITWIAPYFGYARSDKRRGRRTALMGRLVADFAEHSGVDHVIAVELHSPQVEGFFHVPVGQSDSSARHLRCIEARYGTWIGDCVSGYGRNKTGIGVRFPLGLPGGGSS